MAMVPLLFWLLVFACCGVGARYGGRTGRWVAAIYVLACLATLVAWWSLSDWRRTHIPTFCIDLVLLVVLVAVVLKSRRWFPIWMCGFHLIAVLSHLASLFVSGYAFKVYFLLQGFWSVPILFAFAIGAVLDHRAGPRSGAPGSDIDVKRLDPTSG